MKFADTKYQRPDVAAAAQKLTELAQQVKNGDEQAVLGAYQAYVALTDQVETAATIASIRHTVDTRDTFYDGENDYFDENSPVLEDKKLELFRAILASPCKGVLSKQYGPMLLTMLSIVEKSSDHRLVPLQQEENALGSRYDKLYASARIPFEGAELTVAQLVPYKQHTDRSLRKKAYESEGGFFDQHQEELDEIYDKMVQNRNAQAGLLGLTNFVPLGDIRMRRNGYGRAEIQACREAVVRDAVPLIAKLKGQQAQRIGVSDFRFYDDLLSFPDGNPTPTGTPEEILAAGQQMYRDLSKETAEFIDFMMEGGLFDVLSKPGKAPGGYCTYIPETQSPFIFSNFNGTAGDVDVLTHEAGHAFAAYLAARQGLPPELRNPGLESCEIHSMGMEFLTGDYHHLFFGPQIEKYTFSHVEDSLYFLPYGCQVDEFQEIIYTQPGLTPAQRNGVWMELERKYRPWNDFDGLPFYGRGAGWQRQLHIYKFPFYYIDYVLAQCIALSFFLARNQDQAEAWQRYLTLTKKAGTETYPGLVHAAGFQPPFEKGMVQNVAGKVYDWLMAHPKAE